VMCANQDATAQTHLTGDRLILMDAVKWKWGEIPETMPHTPNIRHMSSKLSQTPVSISNPITDHLPDTPAAAVSQDYGLELDSQPSFDSASEQPSPPLSSNTLELVASDGEKGLAESKPLVETNGIQTSTTQPAGSVVHSQIIEPMPETKKGWFYFFVF